MSDAKPANQRNAGAVAYLCVHDAKEALDFYRRGFGATEVMRFEAPDGKIGHAEIRIGDAEIMLADEYPGINQSPRQLGGTPVTIQLYVPDVDRFCARAVAGGATVVRPIEDEFFGDRRGVLRDPFGHVWMVATHKEDVSREEMQRRIGSAFKIT
jgi:PhnB protein